MTDRTSLFQRLYRSRAHVAGLAALATLAPISMIGCSGSSDVTGPGSSNTPPTIQSVVAASAQVEADQSIALTATVSDAETAASQLKYGWSTTPAGGTFAGTGSQVTWKAPVGAETPSTYVITLTVTETYSSGSTMKENRVSSTAQVRYNDSVKEITGLVGQFLVDFGTFSVSPQQCVRNFSDSSSCGKASELNDIVAHRSRSGVQIENAAFPLPMSVTLNPARTSAEVFTRCTFTDRYANGTHGTVTGTCHLSTVYDNFRWFLCTSNFEGPFVMTTYGLDPRSSITTYGFAPPFSHP